MHFSIQNTAEVYDNENQYTVYNLHINGSYHCSLRYSQLHDFNSKLKKEFYNERFPDFPPKKLFNLTQQQIDNRRLELEKYFQLLSQIPNIVNSNYFNNFLLNSQKESQLDIEEDIVLDIFMPNKHKITVSVKSYDHSDTVLQSVTKKISLKETFVYYFGLFLISHRDTEKLCILRRLQDYESPFLSLKIANKLGPHSIYIRKRYWDIAFDELLIEDRISMNILYVQAVGDIDASLIKVTRSQQKELCSLQNDGSKREFLKLARTLKFYGCYVFENCLVDYPKENTQVTISIGMYELHFHPLLMSDGERHEFKVKRMRCWRIANEDDQTKDNLVEISFEYLIVRDKLQWITILSSQAILISSCIQSMVDELIMKRDNLTYEQINLRPKYFENSQTNLKENSRQKVAKVWSSNISISPSITFNNLSDNEAFDGINEDDL